MRFLAPWQTMAVGMALGLAYGIGEHLLDLQPPRGSRSFLMVHDLVEYIVPVALGATAGLLVSAVRRQIRLNRSLSTQNTKLKRQFFTQTLSAHILHEIRNPLHNLAAVIEDQQRQFPKEEAAMLQRNLDRLKRVAERISRWHALDESLDLHESTPLRAWLAQFLADQVRPQLEQLDIAFEHRVESVDVQMHALLLEQCFVTLFNNALEAAGRGPQPRSIVLSARMSPDRNAQVEVEIRNTGAVYPDAVLAVQGEGPIDSSQGMGLGLVLVRRALEQVDGSLRLTNQEGQACTSLWIPGRRQ